MQFIEQLKWMLENATNLWRDLKLLLHDTEYLIQDNDDESEEQDDDENMSEWCCCAKLVLKTYNNLLEHVEQFDVVH